MVSPVDQPAPGVRCVNWSTIAVSPAFWPPTMTTARPRNVTAPPPLVARGRSGRRDQVEWARSKQSTRAVVGERPPAAQTLPPTTKPDTWLRGLGSAGSTVHALDVGSKLSTA